MNRFHAIAGTLLPLAFLVGRNAQAITANFGGHDMWTPKDPAQIRSDLGGLPAVSAASGALGLLIAFCVAQVGSLFSSDAWNNITFTAGEVKDRWTTPPRPPFFSGGFFPSW